MHCSGETGKEETIGRTAHLILLDLITLILVKIREQIMLEFSSASCCAYVFVLGPNILLCIIFSNTHNIRSSVRAVFLKLWSAHHW
jgi:hypothetical protein